MEGGSSSAGGTGGCANVDASAASSPGATAGPGHGSEVTSPSQHHANTAESSPTPSPLTDSTGAAAAGETSPVLGRKRRLSFKDKQRQSTAAAAAVPTNAETDAKGGQALPVHSPTSPACSSSPALSDLSPARERTPHQPAFKKAATTTPPFTGCVFTALEPVHRIGRPSSGSGAARPPNRAPFAGGAPPALAGATSAVGSSGPLLPTSLASPSSSSSPLHGSLRAASSCLQSASAASVSGPHSPLQLPPATATATIGAGATSIAAPHSRAASPPPPPPREPQPLQPGPSLSDPSGTTTTQVQSDDGRVSLPRVRTPTTVSGSAITSPTGFASRTMPEQQPSLSPVSSQSTSSPKGSFKSRQRAAAAAAAPRKTVIAASAAASPSSPPCISLAAPASADSASAAMPPLRRTPTPPSRLRSPGAPSFASPPREPAGTAVAHADPVALPPHGRGSAGRHSTASEVTGASGVAYGPPPLQFSVAADSRVPSRPLPPVGGPALPTSTSPIKRGTQSAPSTRPHFRFFAQCSQTSGGDGEPARTAAERRLHSAQACDGRERSHSTTTVSTNAGDEEEGLLACTQNAVRLHVYDLDDEPAPVEFEMAIPHGRHNTTSSGAASRDGAMTGTASSGERSDTVRGGRGGSLTPPSMQTGESESAPVDSARGPQALRSCMRARTDSRESPLQSNLGSAAARRATASPPTASIRFQHQHYSDNNATRLGTPPTGDLGQLSRSPGSIVDRWKQHRQRDSSAPRELASTHSTLAPMPSSDNSVTFSDARLSHTTRSRRRHRDKMLAPDGTLLTSSNTGRVGGLERSTSLPLSSPRMHQRSYTVDDFTLMALASGGRRGGSGGVSTSGAVTPVSVSPGSRVTAGWRSTSANATHFPPLPIHTVVTAPRSTAASPATARTIREGPPIPLSRTPVVATAAPVETSDGSSATASAEQSVNHSSSGGGSGGGGGGGGVSLFSSGVPPLPAMRQYSGGSTNALATVSFAMASVLIPNTTSAESLSATTPTMCVETPVGHRSVDDLTAYTMRLRPSTASTTTGAYPSAGGGVVTVAAPADDAEDSDVDVLQRTATSHYGGGDSMLSTTAAELRKLRRRSNYSSLQYGTMTGYHSKRTDPPRQASTAASSSQGWHGRRDSAGPRRRRRRTGGDRENEEGADATTVLVAGPGVSAGTDVAVDDGDDDETVREQKGSEEEVRTNEAADDEEREADRSGGAAAAARRMQRRRESRARAEQATAKAAAAEEDASDAAQRRTVGLWTTVEHVFLPRYSLAPTDASTVPLTGPASPNTNTNGSASTVSAPPESTQRHGSPLGGALDGKKSRGAGASPISGTQPLSVAPGGTAPAPAAAVGAATGLTSPPLGSKSPLLGSGGGAGPFLMPSLLTPKCSLSNYPSGHNSGGSKPSGLIVLPDANCSSDAMASASLSCSQFRRTPAQASGTTRLEPEKYTFGTVASTYNVDPVDEEALPQGSCDAKAAARLVFDAAAGVMLMDPEDEVGRYQGAGHPSPDDRGSLTVPPQRQDEEESPGATGRRDAGRADDGDNDGDDDDEAGDGACQCDAAFIAKDFRGLDCSRYDANDLYDHCSRCHRRPASFLCLHCLEAVCPSHVRRHHLQNPSQCTLFLNLLDIMSSFDRIFWCEKCRQFTWKHTEVYDALVDQIAYTRGTYLKQPARDIHCVGYEVRLKDVSGTATAAAAAARPVVGTGGSCEPHPPTHAIHAVPPAAMLTRALSASSLPPGLTAPAAAEVLSSASQRPQRPSPAPAHPHERAEWAVGANPGLLGLLFESPPGGGPLTRHKRPSTVTRGSPPMLPAQPTMHPFLARDPVDLLGGQTVTVGEPVTKLCALGASVQGWRTTQEDAEAVFLVDIPAISEEVVQRQELHAVAAAAAAAAGKETPTRDGAGVGHHLAASRATHDGGDLDTSVASTNPPQFASTLRAGDRGAHEASSLSNEDAATAAAAPETMPMAVFCMFDGHGGDAVAKLAARHFEAHLRRAIEGTRPDDVRARALLFFLKAETDSVAAAGATAPWMPPSVTAVPAGDGTFTYVSTFTNPATGAAVPLVAPSPPASLDAGFGRTSNPPSSQWPSAAPSATLLVPGNRAYPRRLDQNADDTASLPEIVDVHASVADDLRNVSVAASFPVVVPITAESLRLHVTGSMLGLPGASVKEASAPPVDDAHGPAAGGGGGKGRHASSARADGGVPANQQSCHTHSLRRNRKSGGTLDAWEAFEEPVFDAPSAAAAAAVAAASGAAVSAVASPIATAHIVGTEEVRRGSGSSHYTALTAGGVAILPSPAAVVSIPEMEMLRQYFASIMEDALISLDDYLRATPEGVRGDYDCVGCTACVVGITANFVLCANVGDSGAAFYTKDRMKVISVKHRVSDEAEQARIHAAGYAVVNGRIEGMSAVPRALGDFDFKQCGGRGPREQAVSAVPDVTIMPVPNDTDRWGIVLACDGVWDTATLHQVHVALTNTVNDLHVAGSAMEAALHGADLYEHRLRGPVSVISDSPRSSSPGSPPRAARAAQGRPATSESGSSKAPSPIKRASLILKDGLEESMIGYYDDDEDGAAPRLSQVDAILLTAAAGVFAQCVAPEDNDEGIGLDNCSLIIIERRNVQD
ncbi:Protein phosphatase 2C [Novymonas esmeraldas]|uniref:Protein phosphatase 2C n=1 Tax=Novymonas esmeraldas TaxID=1808958 RepID=A0AAW0F4R5_9TRYP